MSVENINPEEFKKTVNRLIGTVQTLLEDVSDEFNQGQLKQWADMEELFSPGDLKMVDESLEIYRIPLGLDHTILFHCKSSTDVANKAIFNVGAHYHDFIEVIYPVNCTMYDNWNRQAFNNIYFIPPGIMHDISIPIGSEYYVLLIKPPILQYLRLDNFITANAKPN